MEKKASGAVERLGGLPWPAQLIVGALALVGAVTVVRWIVTAFAVLITVLTILVVLVALAFWVLTGRRRR